MRKKDDFTLTLIVFALSGLIFLGLDLWEIITGTMNLNKHIPFLFPVVIGIFLFIGLKVKQLTAHLDDKENIPKSSFLHEDNLPKDRYKDDSIG